MNSNLAYLLDSEIADRLTGFIGARGGRARIFSPPWVRERVHAACSSDDHKPAPVWIDISQLERTPPLAEDCNAIIIAEDAEEESRALKFLSVHGHTRNYGLFGDILPALLCGSSPLKRTSTSAPLKRFAIFCVPRSGSRFLAATLSQAGVGRPVEHIREPLAFAICQGKLRFSAAIEGLERFGHANGIFGTKLISSFVIKASGKNLSRLTENIGWMLNRRYHFVHLRRSLNDVAVSNYIANQMQKWHFFDELEAPMRQKLDSLVFDEGVAWQGYVRLRAQQAVVDHIVARYNLPTSEYSEIQKNVGATVDRLCSRMDIERESLKRKATSIPVPARSESATYERFGELLEALLRRRKDEIDACTVHELCLLAGVNEPRARKIVSRLAIA